MVFRNWVVWNKKDGMSAPKRQYANAQEAILFFTKSQKHVFNYDDIRVSYESTNRIKHAQINGILKNGKRWHPNSKGKLCTEVWHFSGERHKNKINGKTQKMPHLTPKSFDMIERMITASSNEGDLVLDCFMGSGTTALASRKLKRNYIGCKNNKIYYQLCMDNLKSKKIKMTIK